MSPEEFEAAQQAAAQQVSHVLALLYRYQCSICHLSISHTQRAGPDDEH